MQAQEATHYQPITKQAYDALGDKSGAYCVEHPGENVLDSTIFGRRHHYVVDGQLHREDGPALIYANGTQEWYRHGQLHRTDGPAIVTDHGQKLVWMHHGFMHREDGPAVIEPECSWWYQQGKLHRLDGPALMGTNGVQKWFQHGVYHREDGPALVRIDPQDGKVLEERWYRHDQLHREDGPALVCPNGTQEWYQKGQLHREDGPAIETQKGTKKWYLHGKQMAYKDMPYVQAKRIGNAIKPSKGVTKKSALGISL